MEKYLKIGIKDSVVEIFWVYFEWVGVDNVIVIGYCGKYFDF